MNWVIQDENLHPVKEAVLTPVLKVAACRENFCDSSLWYTVKTDTKTTGRIKFFLPLRALHPSQFPSS